MVKIEKYNFSFTGFSLRVNEMTKVAEAINEGLPIETADFGNGNRNTGHRKLAEIKKRLNKLTDKEVHLFISGDFIIQKQIAFLSVCKSHKFIRDFVVEVLREKLLVFDYQLSEGDYISFYRRKSELHPEMEKLTEITAYKIKQVTFKILEQAGIIDNIKTKVIQPQLLDTSVTNTIAFDNKEWLKVFFMSDMDIENID
jgi:response regulator RpfG family c-di-GMP phosphodiesterase